MEHTQENTIKKPTSEDIALAVLSHGSLFLGFGVILPLVIFLIKSDSDDDYVLRNAKQALISQVSFFAAYFISGLLAVLVVGLVALPILIILQIVFTVKAIIDASNGKIYDYPITGKWVEKL